MKSQIYEDNDNIHIPELPLILGLLRLIIGEDKALDTIMHEKVKQKFIKMEFSLWECHYWSGRHDDGQK